MLKAEADRPEVIESVTQQVNACEPRHRGIKQPLAPTHRPNRTSGVVEQR